MSAVVPFYRNRSALETFQCPFRWKRKYLDRVPDDSFPALRGRTFHAAKKHYIQALVAHGCSDDLDLATAALDAGIAEELAPDDVIAEVTAIWQPHVEHFELDIDHLLLVEERPQDPDGYDFRPDYVLAFGNTLEVHDDKTYYATLSPAQARAELQPKFYLARARRIWPGFQVYRFVFHFVRFGQAVDVEFSAGELDDVDTQLLQLELAIATAIEQDRFPTRRGAWCTLCRLECPDVPDVRVAPVRASTLEEARQLLGELAILDQAYTARREALHAFTQFHGPVTLHGLEARIDTGTETRFPATAVIDALRAQDVDPTDLTVSRSGLRRYLDTKRFRHVREALEALGTSRPKPTFRIRKAAEAETPAAEGALTV